jgi:hypothetical protein
MDPVGVRIQAFRFIDQILALARIAQARAPAGRFAAADIGVLFDELSLPRPASIPNQLGALLRQGKLTKVGSGRAIWSLTPVGRLASADLATDMDLAALVAESVHAGSASLGNTPHPEVPPSLAPPQLVLPLRAFFENHPFESNVFAMTRFPDVAVGRGDPLAPALDIAREVCTQHGLTLHLASDRKIVDELWPNVAAHIWGSRYGIAFFEERSPDGLNYNLQIEVGSALALGRRLAIVKDKTVCQLPSDLVGQIYHDVDLDRPSTVQEELHKWSRQDLNLGACSRC